MNFAALALTCVLASQVKPIKEADAGALVITPPKAGRVGRYIAVKAATKGTDLVWRIPAGLERLGGDLAPADPKVIGVLSDVAGSFVVTCITAVEDKVAIAEATVTFEPPPAPPEPPAPPDPFLPKLQLAFTADPAPAAIKTSQRALIVGLYEAMAVRPQDDKIRTLDDLLSDLRTVSGQMIPPGALIECRKMIALMVSAGLGTDPAATLDAATRAKASTTFRRIAKSVSELK